MYVIGVYYRVHRSIEGKETGYCLNRWGGNSSIPELLSERCSKSRFINVTHLPLGQHPDPNGKGSCNMFMRLLFHKDIGSGVQLQHVIEREKHELHCMYMTFDLLCSALPTLHSVPWCSQTKAAGNAVHLD